MLAPVTMPTAGTGRDESLLPSTVTMTLSLLAHACCKCTGAVVMKSLEQDGCSSLPLACAPAPVRGCRDAQGKTNLSETPPSCIATQSREVDYLAQTVEHHVSEFAHHVSSSFAMTYFLGRRMRREVVAPHWRK
jgi:hypothetical protein